MRSWSDKGEERGKEWKTARLFDQINPTGETKGARIPQINMTWRETSPCPDSTQVNLTQVWVTKVENILGRLKLLDLLDMLLRGSKATLHNRLHSLQPHVERFAIRRMEMTQCFRTASWKTPQEGQQESCTSGEGCFRPTNKGLSATQSTTKPFNGLHTPRWNIQISSSKGRIIVAQPTVLMSCVFCIISHFLL